MKQLLDSKKVCNYLMKKINKEEFKTTNIDMINCRVKVASKNEDFIFEIDTQYGNKPKFFYLSLLGINDRGINMRISLDNHQVEKLTKAIEINSIKKNKRETVRASRAASRERLRKQQVISNALPSLI